MMISQIQIQVDKKECIVELDIIKYHNIKVDKKY